MDFEMFLFILCAATILFVVLGMRSTAASAPAAKGTSTSEGSKRLQMVEDIKLTKTSRVVDQVSILDELEQTSPGFRQYCELVGTAQREGGVVAPYSRKQVAYYEIRCYRIENRGSGDVETLVAHEKSFDPFYFKDASCDTPVYVDISSFGDNVMLINSTNHVEGPNSDFSKAVQNSGSTGAASTSGVTAIVGEIASGIVHGFGRARHAVSAGLFPQQQLAYAGATLSALKAPATAKRETRFKNLSFAQVKGPGGPGGGDSARFSSGGRSTQGNRGQQPDKRSQQPNNRGGVYVNFNMPSGLGSFLGNGYGSGYSNVPRPRPTYQYPTHTYRRTGMGDVVGDMITGMVLSSILDSMAHKNTVTQTTASQQAQSSFRGYRLVEDVVPLGSPVYCIGELYHHGTDVYMGRSLATDYPTSFFATRPETEVLASLGA